MGLKADTWIRQMALEHGMIEPFVEGQVRKGVMSFGLSSYGYDIRVADEFKVFHPAIRAKTLSDFERGYIAGLLDGEGWIGRAPSADGHGAWGLAIGNRNRSLLEHIQEILGVGQIHARQRRAPAVTAPAVAAPAATLAAPAGRKRGARARAAAPARQPAPEPAARERTASYVLRVTRSADALHILGQVWPYLVHKRERALRALQSQAAMQGIVDPKNFNEELVVDFKGDVCIIPPNSFVLARSVETVRMPRDVTGVVLCKSTYIRAGVLIPTTVLEAGWEGVITLEIGNATPLPAKIYAHEGIAQVLFFVGDEMCETSYADRKGKYQHQTGLVLPRV